MQNPLSRYLLILKRWVWMIVLGIVICSGVSYAITKVVRPNYQASATLILNVCTAQSSAYDCTTAGLEAVPTYAQLVTNSQVLNPVVARHHGLTLKQLAAMIAVKPQSNTLLMEIDVTNSDPNLAAQLANEVSQSFAQFSNTQLPGTVQVIPAQVPTDPVGLKPLYAAAIGGLVGLGLALALMIIFEWVDDHLTGLEEAQKLVGAESTVVFPRLKGKLSPLEVGNSPASTEGCAILCADLKATHKNKSPEFVMVTSALPQEGKSTVAVKLASFLAQSGSRVLLVDANLRSPVLDQIFQLDNSQSLWRTLRGARVKIDDEVEGQVTEVANLRVLSAGASTSNPAELFQSSRLARLFQHLQNSSFDYIIFDTPPLLPFADALAFVPYMQALIFVADASSTPRRALARAGQMLKRMPLTPLAVIINKSPWLDFRTPEMYQQEVEVRQPRAPEESAVIGSDLPDTPFPKVADDEHDHQEVTVVVRRLNSNEHQNNNEHQ
ncbi:MAG TPA: polysaccharide biosynthesis tyrosine autokinase [Ktedonobacteraceae bacterium]|jgi:capsular exopolysaccharide synthesis family protein|nr:polysaccharide biosynthesis tyrosine autokinase [Ktedonobacteraceae bacterium]